MQKRAADVLLYAQDDYKTKIYILSTSEIVVKYPVLFDSRKKDALLVHPASLQKFKATM